MENTSKDWIYSLLGWAFVIGLVVLAWFYFRTSPPSEQAVAIPIDPGAYDCSDFSTHADAQEFFDAHDPANDPYHLDRDHDGIACESLPGQNQIP